MSVYKLKELVFSILVKESNALMENLMHSAFEEVEAFAQEHKWMNDIHSFVAAWNQEILQSWKGQSASKIEVWLKLLCTFVVEYLAVF